MLLVDTSVWVDYLNGNGSVYADALDKVLDNDLVIMGDIILTEILQGFRSDRDFRQAKNLLSTLECHTLLAGQNMAIQCASNYRLLRRRGVTVRKTVDVIIASFCIAQQLPLLHCDRDFLPMEKHLGLKPWL